MNSTSVSSVSLWSLTKIYVRLTLALVLGFTVVNPTMAQSQQPAREIFAPASGRGAIVVVVSGASGPALYRDICARLAALGYYVVLMRGDEVLIPSSDQSAGVAALRSVIADAQRAPPALNGQVALVGFSLGGGGVLTNSGALGDAVSAVVAYYPALSWQGEDMGPLAASLRAPVLLIAAEKDELSCCPIGLMRALASAPKKAAFELATYPEAGHGFNLPNSRFVYRADDTNDAWAKTVAFLGRLHPPRTP